MQLPQHKPHVLASIPPDTAELLTPTPENDTYLHSTSHLTPLPLQQELAMGAEIERTLSLIRHEIWADGAVWRSILGHTSADVFLSALRPIMTLHLETGRHAAEILIARATARGVGLSPQQRQRLAQVLCIDHCQGFVAETMPKIYDGKAAILDSLR